MPPLNPPLIPLKEHFCHFLLQTSWNLVNLWHAKLFYIFESQEESVLHTVSMIYALKKQNRQALHSSTPYTRTRYSMADILVHKDIEGMLDLRNKLREKILTWFQQIQLYGFIYLLTLLTQSNLSTLNFSLHNSNSVM